MNPASPSADIYDSPKQEPRLPPGQILTEKWPVLHHGTIPEVELETWNLRIHGAVENPGRWTWDEFRRLPRRQVRSDIHCVTRWSRYDNLWEGVGVRELIENARPRPDARYAIIHADTELHHESSDRGVAAR